MIDNQKNVDVKQCVKTLIFCAIALLLAMFIPFTYGENTTLSFKVEVIRSYCSHSKIVPLTFLNK